MRPVSAVPTRVTRGTVRSGPSTRPSATIALSKPSMANKVKVAAVLSAAKLSGGASTGGSAARSPASAHAATRIAPSSGSIFSERGQHLHPARRPHAAAIDQGHRPDHRDRDGRGGRRLGEARRKDRQVGNDRERERRIGHPDRDPIGPGDQETRARAEGRGGVGEGRTAAAEAARDPGERDRQAERAGDRRQPAEHRVPTQWRQRRGQQEDARSRPCCRPPGRRPSRSRACDGRRRASSCAAGWARETIWGRGVPALRFAREPFSTNRPPDDLSLNGWCGREDSNFHGLSATATSTLRVYQFRHDRT